MILLLITQAFSKTLALLINTSKDFLNYRHMSNIQAIHKLILQSGFSESNIIPIFSEDPNDDPRNIKKGKIYFDDNYSIDHKLMEPTPLNEHILLNILYLRHKKLLDLDERDNLLIYMCGHSREGFIKVCDRYFIFKDDLMKSLKYLSKRLNKILFILDTCQASTLIDVNEIPKNMAVVTSSFENEFSYSNRNASSLGVASIDDFAYEMFNKGIDRNKKVREYFSEMNNGNLKSTVMCFGNCEMIIDEFFVEKENEVMPFVL